MNHAPSNGVKWWSVNPSECVRNWIHSRNCTPDQWPDPAGGIQCSVPRCEHHEQTWLIQTSCSYHQKSKRHPRFPPQTCPKYIKENTYSTLVRPVLKYGADTWNPYLGKDISSIEMVQHLAARLVTNDNAYTSIVSDMIAELGWHSLADLRSDIRLITLFRTYLKLMEVPTSDILTPNKSSNSLQPQTEIQDQ